MQQTQTQFGGGLISPQLLEHLKRSKEERKAPTKTEFGGGLIAPAVVAHCKRTQWNSAAAWFILDWRGPLHDRR